MKKNLSSIAAIIFLLSLTTGLFAVTLPLTQAATQTYPAWDFEDHSLTHTALSSMTGPEQLESELLAMNSLFANHSLPAPRHFDYPNGVVVDEAVSLIAQYRDTARTSGAAPFPNIYDATDWYRMGAANIDQSKTVDDVKAWINDAVSKKALAIIYTHGVSVNSTAPTYGTTQTVLQGVVDYLVAQQTAGNLSVMTMRQAYTSFNGQKAIIVMAFDDGTDTDYTVVWPMFKAAGIAGTSYIAGNYVESQANSLTWRQIQEMAQVGEFAPATPATAAATAWGALVQVSPSSGGTTNYGSGSIILLQGAFTVRATPAAGYAFDHWTFQGVNYNTSTVTLPQQPYGTLAELTAVFRPTNATPSTAWSLNVRVNGTGTTTPTGTVNVTSGSIRVNATAGSNSTFSYWLFDNANVTSAFNVTSTNTTSSILVPVQAAGSNHTLTAVFANATVAPSVWRLNVTVNGTGGTTTPSGVLNVTSGSITVNATAAANYTFSQWRLDNVTIANTTSVTVPAQAAGSNHTLTAYFNPVWNLTIQVNGTVGGTTSPSGNITVTTGSITVNATAAANYTFSAWLLDNMTIANTTMVTVPPQAPGSSHILTAVFVRSASASPATTVAVETKP